MAGCNRSEPEDLTFSIPTGYAPASDVAKHSWEFDVKQKLSEMTAAKKLVDALGGSSAPEQWMIPMAPPLEWAQASKPMPGKLAAITKRFATALRNQSPRRTSSFRHARHHARHGRRKHMLAGR